MSKWKTAEEARKICEEHETYEHRMREARETIAKKIEKSLEVSKHYVEIRIDEVPVNREELEIIKEELINDKYDVKIEEEELLEDRGVAWGKLPVRLFVEW